MAQPVDFFAYGAHLDQNRMRDAVGGWDSATTACLLDHRLRFTGSDALARWGSADLEAAPGERVYGVVYRIFSEQFMRLRRSCTGYVERRIMVETGDDRLRATTLVVASPCGKRKPSKDHLRDIEEGMRQHGFSPVIRATLLNRADGGGSRSRDL
jgi:hypothetical protein